MAGRAECRSMSSPASSDRTTRPCMGGRWAWPSTAPAHCSSPTTPAMLYGASVLAARPSLPAPEGAAMTDEHGDLAQRQRDASGNEVRRETEVKTVNPANGQPCRTYPANTPEQARAAAAAAKQAQASS